MRVGFAIRWVAVAIVVVAAFDASRASAAPLIGQGARFATVFSERIDGESRDTSTVEAEVARALLARKLELVDVAQSRAIRAQLANPSGAPAELPADIGSFDADVIIQGSASLRRVESRVLPENVHRYEARVEARIIRVDSAAILASVTLDRGSLGVSKTLAISNTAKRAAEALAEEIGKLVGPDAATELELFVSGLPDVGAGTSLRRRIRSLPRIEQIDVRTESSANSRYVIRSTHADARSLAEVLQERKLGITVTGYAQRVVHARYIARAPVRIDPRGVEFSVRGKLPAPWLGRTLPELVTAALASDDRIATSDEPTHVLRGHVRSTKDGVEVRAQITARGGRSVADARTTCADAPRDAAACAQRIGATLRERLSLAQTSARNPARRATLQVELEPLAPMFPAVLAASPDTTVGTVRLTNRGRRPFENVLVRARVPSLSRRRVVRAVPRIEPGATIAVPIRIHVDRDALANAGVPRSAVLELGLEYPNGEFVTHEHQEHPVLAYAATTLDWRDPAAVGPFVQPRAAQVSRLATQVLKRRPRTQTPAGRAARLYVTLAALGLRYRVDTTRPFLHDELDDVRFPDATLREKTGDCDDLSILAASIGEALGERMLLLLTPRHVLVAVGTGLAPQASSRVPATPEELIVHDGELFVPLETTKPDASFEEAWREGLRTWRAWDVRRDERAIVDVRDVWRRRPPIAVPPGDPVELPDAARLAEATGAAEARVLARYERRKRARLAALDEALTRASDGAERSRLQLKRAWMLARAGDVDAARAALPSSKTPSAEHALLLGNIEMQRSKPAEALTHFEHGIRARDARHLGALHVNAAIAAIAAGDRKSFDEHVLAALEHGRRAEVEALSRAGRTSAPAGGKGAAAVVDWSQYLVWHQEPTP